MMRRTITLHTLSIHGGGQVEYARVVNQEGSQILGRSILLHRLSSEQLREARTARMADQYGSGARVQHPD
jgi:hypothetical protein